MFEMASAITTAKEEFEDGRKQALDDVDKIRVRSLNELETMIESAISQFIDDASASVHARFGESMDIVPFIANTAGVASNFLSITQCVVMMLTMMPEDIHYDISTGELDMFTTLTRVLPSLCPLPNKTGLPPKPNEDLGDLVGAQVVTGTEADKEKTVTSTSADNTGQLVSDRSRCGTPVPACESSQPPITKATPPAAPFSIGQFLTTGDKKGTLAGSGSTPNLIVNDKENVTLLRVQSTLKARFNSRDASPASSSVIQTSPQGTSLKKQKLSQLTSTPIFDKPRQAVKSYAADKGLEMVTNRATGSAFEEFDTPDDEEDDLLKEDNDDDDDDDNEVTYVCTTKLEYPYQPRRSTWSTSSSAPQASDSGLFKLNSQPVTAPDRGKPSSTTPKGRKKGSSKVAKQTNPSQAPVETPMTAKEKERNWQAARTIQHSHNRAGIKAIREKYNLPETGTWDMDMSSELDFMDQEWQQRNPKSFSKMHIFTVKEVQDHLETQVGHKDISERLWESYKKALESLAEQSIRTPFPKPSKESGGRDVLMQHISVVMVDEKGNFTTNLDADIHRREMMGLQTLHIQDAIYRAQIWHRRCLLLFL